MAKLHCRYGAMSAGKSLQLLAVKHNYEERGMRVAVFTAAIDDRYGRGVVTSRVGVSTDAKSFDRDTEFDADTVGEVACCLVDESQFLTGAQVRQLHRLAHIQDGIPVICFGIRTDFRGLPFEGSAMLLSLADDIEEIKTICGCSRKASMNVRIREDGLRVTEGEQVEIGGNSRYLAVCARCFYKGL